MAANLKRFSNCRFGLTSPRWMPDGQSVVVATTVIPELAGSLAKADLAAMKKEIKRRKDSKMTARVTENRQYRYFDHYLVDSSASRLLVVNLATKEFKDLMPKWTRPFTVSGEVGYDLSPDGKQIAVTLNTTPPPYQDYPNHDVYLISTDGKEGMEDLTIREQGDDTNPTFSPDGKSLVFTRQTIPYYGGEFAKLWRHDLVTGKNTPLTTGLDYSFDNVKFSADGKTIWTAVEEKGVVPVFKLNADGTGFAAVYSDGTSSGLDTVAGSVVFLNDKTVRPAELFALDPATGTARQLTHFNDAEAGRDRIRQGGELLVHGGQQRADSRLAGLSAALRCGQKISVRRVDARRTAHDESRQLELPLEHGAVCHAGLHRDVCEPPRVHRVWREILPEQSSTNGRDAIRGHHEERRFPDQETAGDRPGTKWRRPVRVMVATWPRGCWSHRPFKAIIDHAGVNSSLAQYATDVPHGFPDVMGGKPWDNVEGMRREDPMTYAKELQDSDADHARRDRLPAFLTATASNFTACSRR